MDQSNCQPPVKLVPYLPKTEFSSEEDFEEEGVEVEKPEPPPKPNSLQVLSFEGREAEAPKGTFADRLKEFKSLSFVQIGVSVCAFVMLVISDLRSAFFDRRFDLVFDAVIWGSVLVLTTEFAASCRFELRYWKSLYFYIELAVVASSACSSAFVKQLVGAAVGRHEQWLVAEDALRAISLLKVAKVLKYAFSSESCFEAPANWRDFVRRDGTVRRLVTDYLRGSDRAKEVLFDPRNSRLGSKTKTKALATVVFLVAILTFTVPLFDFGRFAGDSVDGLREFVSGAAPLLAEAQPYSLRPENWAADDCKHQLSEVVVDGLTVFQDPDHWRLRETEKLTISTTLQLASSIKSVKVVFSVKRWRVLRSLFGLCHSLLLLGLVALVVVHHYAVFTRYFFGMVPAVLERLREGARRPSGNGVVRTTDCLLGIAERAYGRSNFRFLVANLFKFETGVLRLNVAKKTFGLFAVCRVASLTRIMGAFQLDPCRFLSEVIEALTLGWEDDQPAVASLLGGEFLLVWRFGEKVVRQETVDQTRVFGVTTKEFLLDRLKLKDEAAEAVSDRTEFVLTRFIESAESLEAAKASFFNCSRVNNRKDLVALGVKACFHIGFCFEGFTGSAVRLDYARFSTDLGFLWQMRRLGAASANLLVSGTVMDFVSNNCLIDALHPVVDAETGQVVFAFSPGDWRRASRRGSAESVSESSESGE